MGDQAVTAVEVVRAVRGREMSQAIADAGGLSRGRREDDQAQLDARGRAAEFFLDQVQVVQRVLIQPPPEGAQGEQGQGEAPDRYGQVQPVAGAVRRH